MRINLADLDLFAAVARTRSFRAAAVELGLSTSTLSERFRALEERLDVRLLNRTTRSVSLTEAGARLLVRVTPALGELAQAVDEAGSSTERPSGLLRINAPTPAIRLVLGPMLAPFLTAYPAIRVEIVRDDGFTDIVAEGFDAGVRYEESLARDMIAVPLSTKPQRYCIHAAPSLLARIGRPKEPADLIDKPCIRYRFSSGRIPDWEFEKDGKVIIVKPDGPVITSDTELAQQACIDGLGFWGIFEGFADRAVADGLVERVLDDWCQPFSAPYLYYPSRRNMPTALRAFIDFVRTRNDTP
jgi:DNA-binding transcriptional LysR family regulator